VKSNQCLKGETIATRAASKWGGVMIKLLSYFSVGQMWGSSHLAQKHLA